MPGTDSERKATGENTVGLEEFRRSLTEFGDRAWDGERFIVTRHDRERFVTIGWRDYERLRALEASAA